MSWQEVEEQIRQEIRPEHSRILKADGVGRRLVTSNDGKKIGMRTGVKTPQSKTITYEMIKYAIEMLSTEGRFDSRNFRLRFDKEYEDAPCRFSMTGGTLVEIGLAKIIPSPGKEACYYVKK